VNADLAAGPNIAKLGQPSNVTLTQQECHRLQLIPIQGNSNRHDVSVFDTEGACSLALPQSSAADAMLLVQTAKAAYQCAAAFTWPPRPASASKSRNRTVAVCQRQQTVKLTSLNRATYRRNSMKATRCGQLAGWRLVTLPTAVLLVSAAVLLSSLPAAAADDAAAAAAPVRVIVRLSEMPAAMVNNDKRRPSGVL
jgi:hypothetical protein